MLLDWISLALTVVVLLVLVVLFLRSRPDELLRRLRDDTRADTRADTERNTRELRDDVARSAVGTRQELGATLASFQQTLLAQQGDTARTQNEQIDSFRTQLAATQQTLADTLRHATITQDAALARLAEQQANALQRFSATLNDQLKALTQANDQRMGEMRASVEQKLAAIQADNERKLEQMRATVDEKLHATLEQRLGESFKQVADRLDQVHRGLGEMQTLARDVGSLSRVLNNVKTRGIFGEVQLAGLLEQVFTPDQYAVNVETVPGSGARVEFAIRLPGQRADGVPLWLPIDAKFPREDYERLLDAQERADPLATEAAAKAIETRLRNEAKAIRDKYLAPPHTTDFAILFVPTEGLYAEALRRPGLMEALQREYRVMLAGPTTLLATLNSLQMGFRTLALEKRSVEVWEVLGAVKTEFQKFGDALAKTRKKLDEASSSIEMAERRSRVMARELRAVEALPESRAQALLPMPADDELAGGEQPA
ncbi:DNA recombination protein RmuC [Rhizobacter sp. Root1221]|uniref:DNA recombination protein RmuC n=1 Tax=Rhizobacter sp. Root1221 TaxID=1736433 RepID=UPI0006F200D0|nr:DNA recombination protein RmuC [Rhizobacter sp. Root1221]KQV96804.1 recombinase RmuC [Rhizobacter sp. Root1221]